MIAESRTAAIRRTSSQAAFAPLGDTAVYETGVPGGVGKLRHTDNIPSEQCE